MESLVTTQWLARELHAPDLTILDASMHLADTGRDARGEFATAHVPGARFLDLATLVDPDSPIENTLPGPDDFAARTEALGVTADRRVVLYDDSAIRSAARAWFLFKLADARNVAILDGGLPKWKADGLPLTAEVTATATVSPPPPALATARLVRLVRDKAAILANLVSRAEQVVDARGEPRFAGLAPEPRPGIAPGHIPGATNVPYASLFKPDGTFKDEAAIRTVFETAGVDLSRPIVTTCGSGVTASALSFALDRIGKADVALYDGSWAEWGADPATPKETGPAR